MEHLVRNKFLTLICFLSMEAFYSAQYKDGSIPKESVFLWMLIFCAQLFQFLHFSFTAILRTSSCTDAHSPNLNPDLKPEQ